MSISQTCFTGDTLVSAEDGQKRIDEIEAGDKVWAYDIYTGKTELKEVLTVYVHDQDEILHLKTTAGDIDTTSNHPFYVMDKGWVAAGDLENGDEVYLIDGDSAVVTGSELEKPDEAIKVYNLEVEGYNTYFVGDDGVLVHNYPGNGTGEGAGQVKDSEGSTNLKVISDPSRLLETTANPQDHHIIPAFRGKSKPYADFIKNLGIDVDQYTITVSGGKGGMHMNFIHGKGKWNQKWMNYIDSNPYATAKDIYQFAGKMMDDYGLSGLQIHPYGK